MSHPTGISAHPSVAYRELTGERPDWRFLNDEQLHLTYNGRGAIYHVLQAIAADQARTILLPAFHCPTVVDPAIEAGFKPRYYRIEPDLRIDEDDLISKIDSTVGAALIINYFGFEADITRLLPALRDAGIPLIEDCAHSFLADNPTRVVGSRGDISIFSFRKIAASVVGGGYRINNADLNVPPPDHRVPIWTNIRDTKELLDQLASNSDGNFIAKSYQFLDKMRKNTLNAPEDDFRSTGPEHTINEFTYPFDRNTMSAKLPAISRFVLERAKLHDIAQKRRSHFCAYLDNFHPLPSAAAVFDFLDQGTVPWAFPVRLSHRSRIDRILKQAGIPLFTFGETLHPSFTDSETKRSTMYKDTIALRDSLICFSIHQQIPAQYIPGYCNTIQTTVAKGV